MPGPIWEVAAADRMAHQSVNMVTLWCYSWESRMYYNKYQALNSAGKGYNCIHTYAWMLTFCVTAIIYYIIINSAYAPIKSTNMIYHNCVYQGCLKYQSNMPRAHFDPKAFEVSITNIISNVKKNINKFLPNTIIYFTRYDFYTVIYFL